MATKEYFKEYYIRNKDRIKEYNKEYYKKYVKSSRIKYKKYVIYDLSDNYIMEGSIKDIAKYAKREEGSIRTTISHINSKRENRRYIIINGKKCTIHKVEE